MKDILNGIKNKTEQATKNPGAKFGMLYIYILIVGLMVGVYYVKNLEQISRQNVPPVLPDTTVVNDLVVKSAMNVPPININEVSKPNPELIAEGEKLYKTNCASCHGENGAGGGPASMGLNPAPRNFTSKDNWKNKTTVSGLYTTLQEGLAPSAMIAYDFLLPREKFAIAHYLRSSFIPDPENDTDGDLQALDATYNLSAGLTLAAQIPVKSASFLVFSENEKTVSKIESTLLNIDSFKNEKGYDLLKKVSSNPRIAFMFLTKNSIWKQNESQFEQLVVDNVNQNGFNASVFNLNDEEWNSLYTFILKLI